MARLLLGLIFLGTLVLEAPVEGVAAQGRGRNGRTRLSLKFYDIEHCKDKEHALRINNVSVFMDRSGDSYWDVQCQLLAPVQSFRSMAIIIHRCRGGVSPSLCEYNSRWSWGAGICTLLTMRGMLWTPLVSGIRPPFACPVPKGHYTVHNSTIDISSLDRPGLDVEKFIWLVEFQLTNERGALHLCFKFAMEPRRVKV